MKEAIELLLALVWRIFDPAGGSPEAIESKRRRNLFLLGAGAIIAFEVALTILFGWPQVPGGIALSFSLVDGIRWGIFGFFFLLFFSVVFSHYLNRHLGENMVTGSFFFYGVFLGHTIFDGLMRGDWGDSILYSASAACVMWFGVFIIDKTIAD